MFKLIEISFYLSESCALEFFEASSIDVNQLNTLLVFSFTGKFEISVKETFKDLFSKAFYILVVFAAFIKPLFLIQSFFN